MKQLSFQEKTVVSARDNRLGTLDCVQQGSPSSLRFLANLRFFRHVYEDLQLL